jgi:ribulose-phosphate 3-epimerase
LRALYNNFNGLAKKMNRAFMTIIQIAPSILAADFTRLGEQIKDAETAGADLIHIDVMDGSFVPNITMGPLIVEAARRVTGLPLDVHLMIVEPERHIEVFAKSGASRITVHHEASPNLHRTLTEIHELGCKAGVAINPHSPALLLSEVLPLLDQINVMTVNPGFGGQTFLPETLPKIAELRRMINEANREIDIEVDGGIDEGTIKTAADAGANVMIVGSAFFNIAHTPAQSMQALKNALS